jgi:ribonuclease VapC
VIAVDASALVAILLEEPEAISFREFLLAQSDLVLSPIGYWEATTRLRSLRGDSGVAELQSVIHDLRIRVVPATWETARLACDAEATFGKRTSAKLNLGDCFAYALAKETASPLLFKGNDFSETDVIPAIPAMTA